MRILGSAIRGSVLGCAAGFLLIPMAHAHTIESRMAEFGEPVRLRLSGDFRKIQAPWPPARLDLLAFKEEKRLEAWVPRADGKMTLLKSYLVLAASGGPGPKLREGDGQVPEGIYGIEYLNPNSRFHLSLKISYPNARERLRAKEEGRTRPGGDIMIHGNRVSIGCLAMGDPAAEELFIMAAHAGVRNIRVVIAPVDFRVRSFSPGAELPEWTPELYRELAEVLRNYITPDSRQ